MSTIIAGAASGFVMASVFVGAGVLMLFAIVRDPPPGLQPLLRKFPPGGLAMSGVILAYLAWGAIGVVMGLLYRISTEQAPGGGLGSPNLVFTASVVLLTVAMAAPFAILLWRVVPGVLAIAVGFIVLFGWFMPYFAA